jgi:hypothetical protein
MLLQNITPQAALCSIHEIFTTNNINALKLQVARTRRFLRPPLGVATMDLKWNI